MDSQRFNLTKGDIGGKLVLISLPIIGTQLMLMGYNLVDMFLLGRVGADAVASSGSAGMFMWLANGFMLVGRMGGEIGVAQAKGRGDKADSTRYAHNSIFLAISIGLLFGAFSLVMPRQLIGFLNIQEASVAEDAAVYLAIIGVGAPAIFISSAIGGIFTGSGNSRVPFFINAVGLVLNAILDPLFIFTIGMGVTGAAIATTISQILSCTLSIYWLRLRRDTPFPQLRFLVKPLWSHIRQILRWALPVSVDSLLFTFFTMIVARQIASHGSDAIAVYRVGSQAESLCWLVCLGFSSGLTAFVGQNFGAGRWTRIWSGFRLSLVLILIWGGMATALFILAGRWLTGLFVPVEHIIEMGGNYLRILAYCQMFFCIESIAGGAFRGLGRTAPPSIAATVCNALRVPTVYLLSDTSLGLNGVWWGITMTAILRGSWVFIWFLKYARSKPKADTPHNDPLEQPSSEVPSVRLLP